MPHQMPGSAPIRNSEGVAPKTQRRRTTMTSTPGSRATISTTMIRDPERRSRRGATLIAAVVGFLAGSCVGPGLEPPGDDGRDFGEPAPMTGGIPTTPSGMQPSLAGSGAPASPTTQTPERPAVQDAGAAREDDAGTDDSGLK
jgi:hypothetical protein